MPQITLNVNASAMADMLDKFGQSAVDQTQEIIFKHAYGILKEMREEGKRPGSPILWTSKQQQIAFFRSKGFGHGVPSVRTQAHVRGWNMDRTSRGMTIYNNVAGSKYIFGDATGGSQQEMYRDAWPLFRGVVDKIYEMLPEEVRLNLRKLVEALPKEP